MATRVWTGRGATLSFKDKGNWKTIGEVSGAGVVESEANSLEEKALSGPEKDGGQNPGLDKLPAHRESMASTLKFVTWPFFQVSRDECVRGWRLLAVEELDGGPVQFSKGQEIVLTDEELMWLDGEVGSAVHVEGLGKLIRSKLLGESSRPHDAVKPVRKIQV